VTDATTTQLSLQDVLASHRQAAPTPAATATATVTVSRPSTSPQGRSFQHPVRPPSNPASEGQKRLLKTMLGERAGNPEAEAVRARLNEWGIGNLTKAGFTSAFEDLKAIPKNAAPKAPEAQADEAPERSAEERNRTAADFEGIWPGIYTVESADAPSGHYTFRVELQAPDADFAPGEKVIGLLTGPNNEQDYTSFGFVKGGSNRLMVWKKKADLVSPAVRAAADQLMADPNAEGIIAAKFCLRCGATLSVPASVAAGLGPECIKKGW
jgi:hypothetical protein